MLEELPPNKTSGPDAIPKRELKGTAKEISPFMACLYNASLWTRELPKNWTQANITPIFKKGSCRLGEASLVKLSL